MSNSNMQRQPAAFISLSGGVPRLRFTRTTCSFGPVLLIQDISSLHLLRQPDMVVGMTFYPLAALLP